MEICAVRVHVHPQLSGFIFTNSLQAILGRQHQFKVQWYKIIILIIIRTKISKQILP